MKKLIFLSVVWISSIGFSSEKMNACFMTLNSSEEKHVFKQKLSTGENKGKFEFHELVPQNDEFNWFKLACEKNIRCDLLVISGHFGGSFFGESGKSLQMKEMETRSCKNDCQGIMSDPKEVFLLGCNTLAGKEEDNRSASEYLEVLLADEIPLDEASRTVEQRYGAIGTSYKDNMRRAFKGVPHIYGFDSIGPAGNTIERMLKSYHEDVPNYFDHLLKIELERGLALMNEFDQWNKKNEALARALRITHFAQTSGVLIPCAGLQGVSQNDPSYELLNNICKLRSDSLSTEEAGEHIKELLLRDDFDLYLSVISDYIKEKSFGDEIQSVLSKHPEIKNNILGLLEESKTGMGKLQTAKLALELKILNKAEFKNIEKNVIVSYLKPPVSLGSKDAICSYRWDTDEDIKVDMKDLDPSIATDFYAIEALNCLGVYDRSLAHSILKTAKTHKNKKLRMQAIITLGNVKIEDSEVSSFIKKSLKKTKNPDDRVAAFVAGALLEMEDDIVLETFEDFLDSRRTVTHNGYTTSEREVATNLFGSIKLESYEQLKFYVGKMGSEVEDWSVASALANLGPSEYFKYLADPNTSDQKNIRHNLYSFLTYDSDEEIPYEITPYLLKDFQGNDDFSGLYRVGSTISKMNLDEQQKNEVVDKILNEPFPNEAFRNFIWNFPENFETKYQIKYLIGLYNKDKEVFKDDVSSYIYHRLFEVNDVEKEMLKPLLSVEDPWLQYKLKQLGVE
ncbi:MAG: hypothetical protein CME64_00960 [Halobacteriovoraceae bacterium]|nr:hypothetical protein [Halobacteriovoraceae bacterium]|tara:strand:- start:208568 stop:210775 length:2208 start_codon:yes stop_codon:yes gene_type:complete